MTSLRKPASQLKSLAARQTQKIADRALERKEETFSFLKSTGDIAIFAARFFREVFKPPYEFHEIARLCFEIGYKTFGLVAVTGFIMGLVLTIQSRPPLEDFGAEAMLPGMVAISLVREIGPVITALLCAGKIGSSIGAELGSMKVTEQIDAMEVSGANPYKYLVVTRVLAVIFSLPLLVVYADFMGLIGSFIGINIKGDVSLFLYFSQAFASLDFIDILPATVKSIVFGFVIGIIGCYKGFMSGRGTESVGKAANEAVVQASLIIFLVDMIAVQVTDLLYQYMPA